MKKLSYNNLALILCAIIIIGASVYVKFFQPSPVSSNSNSTNSYNSIANQLGVTAGNGTSTAPNIDKIANSARIGLSDYNLDTDKDGLMDWEEVLWGTDVNNPDTDKDGMKDGEEVAKKRNPTVKGAGNLANDQTSSTTLTQTDKFGRELFAKYLELRQLGLSADPDSKERLIAAMLQSGNLVETPKIYKTTDLILLPTSNPTIIRNYGNTISSVIKNNTIRSRNENLIIKDYIEQNDDTKLAELTPILNSYNKIVKGLLSVGVPKELKDYHIELINSVSELAFIIGSYKKIETDPVIALQGVGMYQDSATKFQRALSSLRDYFTGHIITYNKGEAGELLNTPDQLSQ